MGKELLSIGTLVESPFVIVKIGEYTFGNVSRYKTNNAISTTFPNYMHSITATKINGEINTYVITMIYKITVGDDPNLLERVFSTVSNTRELTLSYGDWNAPGFIYKEEKALIQNIKTDMDFAGSKITYTISCIGTANVLNSSCRSFPAIHDKPSNIIKKYIKNNNFGLVDIFTGMRDYTKVISKNCIASDDMVIELEAKDNISIVDYLNYLVNCMEPHTGKGIYKLTFYDASDDPDLGGQFFKIKK